MSRGRLAAAVFACAISCANANVVKTTTPTSGFDGVLRGPFDVEAARARMGRPLPEPGDAPAHSPVIGVEGVSFYTDADKSIADPALQEQNLAALRPLRTFVAFVVKSADGWVQSNPARAAYARQAMDAMAAWADAGALLGVVNQQGEFEREWTLGSLSLAFLKVRDAPGVAGPRRAVVAAWLRQIAQAVQPYYQRPQLTSNNNNHAYWTGLAVAAAGVAANDRPLFEWGIARGRIGVAQVSAEGLLPLELERRALALHYHVFAVAPLIMLAELAEANGIHLYDAGNRAILRLVDRTIQGLADPAAFAARAGIAQKIDLPPRKTDIAWAEAYHARFHDPRVEGWLSAARPLYDVRLGGDVTTAFGLSSLSR